MKLKIFESNDQILGVALSEKDCQKYIKDVVSGYADELVDRDDIERIIYEDFYVISLDEYNSKPYAYPFIKLDDFVDMIAEVVFPDHTVGDYGILCRNRGMWGGIDSWMTKDGKTLRFKTEQDAKRYLNKIETGRSRVNNFTNYFVSKF